MPKTRQELIPTAEAARVIGVDVRTVHRMADSGLLPPELKLPGRTGALLFDRGAVEELAARRSAEAIPA